MGVIRRGAAAGLLALALAGWAHAQPPPPVPALTPPAPPAFPRIAEALGRPHQPTAVPPGLEIEVLDPNVDPRGNPAVITTPGPDGRILVDVPPTVLVHRYYYTGDRSFQAPLLPGGPCIVVANHPKTGERLYVPVQFPPGAPRVTYSGDAIDYDYGSQGVTINFCCLFCAGPKVTYRNGVTLTRQAANVASAACDAARRLIERTGIPECADKAASGAKSVVVTTVDRANDLGKRLAAPPIALIRATPLAGLFTESPETAATKARDAAVQRAAQQAQQADIFIKTNR